ncbi:MAG TPA: biotin transporter BioY [Actinomycetota bacterium]|nr:biotin transporter BioY [Actinomycetota bacterium]
MTALAQALPRPRSRTAGLALDATLVLAGSLFIGLLAQVSIRLPFTPVPVTGQTLAVLLVGTAYGWARGGLTVAVYLAEIAAGLPFAAEGEAGATHLTLATPSGGYLWGFLVAATLCGWLANRGWDRNVRSSLGVMLLGNVVIFAFGIPWLAASIDVPAAEALELGLYPFVVGDLLKLLIAAGALPAAWRLVRTR